MAKVNKNPIGLGSGGKKRSTVKRSSASATTVDVTVVMPVLSWHLDPAEVRNAVMDDAADGKLITVVATLNNPNPRDPKRAENGYYYDEVLTNDFLARVTRDTDLRALGAALAEARAAAITMPSSWGGKSVTPEKIPFFPVDSKLASIAGVKFTDTKTFFDAIVAERAGQPLEPFGLVLRELPDAVIETADPGVAAERKLNF
jgi:hypothetical protein